MGAQPLRFGDVIVPRRALLYQVSRLREFHLDGMNARVRLAVVARGPAALESPVQYDCTPVRPARDHKQLVQSADHRSATIGPDVEVRQCAVRTEIRDFAADRMAIVEDCNAVRFRTRSSSALSAA